MCVYTKFIPHVYIPKPSQATSQLPYQGLLYRGDVIKPTDSTDCRLLDMPRPRRQWPEWFPFSPGESLETKQVREEDNLLHSRPDPHLLVHDEGKSCPKLGTWLSNIRTSSLQLPSGLAAFLHHLIWLTRQFQLHHYSSNREQFNSSSLHMPPKPVIDVRKKKRPLQLRDDVSQDIYEAFHLVFLVFPYPRHTTR